MPAKRNKLDVVLSFLAEGSVQLHLYPRTTGVVVPPMFKAQAILVLEIGLNAVIPITDLNIDEDGVKGTLSFNRRPFYCVLPWESIFAVVSSRGTTLTWGHRKPMTP